MSVCNFKYSKMEDDVAASDVEAEEHPVKNVEKVNNLVGIPDQEVSELQPIKSKHGIEWQDQPTLVLMKRRAENKILLHSGPTVKAKSIVCSAQNKWKY